MPATSFTSSAGLKPNSFTNWALTHGSLRYSSAREFAPSRLANASLTLVESAAGEDDPCFSLLLARGLLQFLVKRLAFFLRLLRNLFPLEFHLERRAVLKEVTVEQVDRRADLERKRLHFDRRQLR
jgi:hypothetical protein